MSVSGTIRALVTSAKKTPAKVEMLAVADLPKESAIKRTLGKCDVLVEGKQVFQRALAFSPKSPFSQLTTPR